MKEGVDGGIQYLPEEIIRDILKRLPAKSLLRFQCVCRHWRNIFKTASFIADHLHHSNHRNPYLLFQRIDWHETSNLYWLDSEMQVCEFQNPSLLDYLKCGKIVGFSNGLLCAEINKHDLPPHYLLVWNPSIREVRFVPQTNFLDYDDYSIGFGFNPIINDYKIVITYGTEYVGNYIELSAVKVYSLSSGSWKEVNFIPSQSVYLYIESVTVNGVMFWWGLRQVGEDGYEHEDVIISFDLAMEVFKFTVSQRPDKNSILRLSEYEGKLAIVSCLGNSEHSVTDLWVMEEVVGASSERCSWIKKYSSSPYPCMLYPVTIWRNEVVCWADVEDESTAVFFNPSTKKVNKFTISKFDNDHYIFNYAESLVPVGGTKSSYVNFL